MTNHFISTWREAIGKPADRTMAYPRISFDQFYHLDSIFDWLTPLEILLLLPLGKKIGRVAPLGSVYQTKESMAKIMC